MNPLFQRSMCVAMMALVSTAAARAQTQAPDASRFAIGFSGGAAIRTNDAMETGWFLAASGEGYLTPRVSIRGQFGGTGHNVTFHVPDVNVWTMHVTGNVIYNWELGQLHPYVGAGVGWYRYRFQFGNGTNRPTESTVGANIGGGIEYFFTGQDAVTGDITFHLMPDVESQTFVYPAGHVTVAIGYKRYF